MLSVLSKLYLSTFKQLREMMLHERFSVHSREGEKATALSLP